MLKIRREHHPVRFSCLAAIFWSSVLLFSSAIAKAQEKIDLDVVRRIHDAACNHSQVMNMVGYLTDVIGPRLSGSPNLKRAREYTRDRLPEWGLASAHLEGWGQETAGQTAGRQDRPAKAAPAWLQFVRRATMGSIFAALRAGRYPARSATTASTATIPTNVSGSLGAV